MQRFIGKKIYKKIVRPISNSARRYKVSDKQIKNKKENPKEENMNEKINKINEVLDVEKLPKRKVKVEKKDKGLIERTENSTILITEDNKMLLND